MPFVGWNEQFNIEKPPFQQKTHSVNHNLSLNSDIKCYLKPIKNQIKKTLVMGRSPLAQTPQQEFIKLIYLKTYEY